MAEKKPSLEALRRDIDRIDEAMHDLLMRRTETVLAIAEAKRASGEPVLRPAREAAVLRRLVARHKGRFAKTALVRVWREIMAGQVRVQAPFSIAVLAPEGRGQLAHLAHDHFGSATPLRGHESTTGVLRAVSEGEATVGVLPPPAEEEADPWWPALAGNERNTPRIVARMPFASTEPRPGAEALAIARMEQEESGADHSYLIVETGNDAAGPASRRAVTEALTGAGLAPLFLTQSPAPDARGVFYLAEVGSFVGRADPRLARIGPVARRAVAVGGFAVPLAAAELGEDA